MSVALKHFGVKAFWGFDVTGRGSVGTRGSPNHPLNRRSAAAIKNCADYNSGIPPDFLRNPGICFYPVNPGSDSDADFDRLSRGVPTPERGNEKFV